MAARVGFLATGMNQTSQPTQLRYNDQANSYLEAITMSLN
jgi:hypothetical protein